MATLVKADGTHRTMVPDVTVCEARTDGLIPPGYVPVTKDSFGVSRQLYDSDQLAGVIYLTPNHVSG